jgi:hypothetical protein
LEYKLIDEVFVEDVEEMAEIKALVESEVRRQLGETRKEIDQAIAEVRERTVDDRATLVERTA